MEFKGTQGEWKIEKNQHIMSGFLILNENEYQIANVDNEYIKSIKECTANAKLIASAPEMLEMLKYSLILLKETTEHEVLDTFKIKCDTIEELIKKATTI